MNNIINKIKKDTGNSSDIIIKKLSLNTTIYIVFNEVLCSGEYINDFILKKLTTLSYYSYNTILNNIPSNSLITSNSYTDILKKLFQGFCLIIVENKYILIEAKASLDRSISNSDSEITTTGPKDAFVENFNKNLGLIRKRIRSNNLIVDSYIIGNDSNTKVGLCYMKNIANKNLVNKIKKKLSKINIDGVIDTGYIRELLLENEKIFPTIIITERPDNVCQSLLEGKISIIVDNSPYVIILPTFFIDLFHTPDDYYQKNTNVTFTRIIRFISFIISIFLPALYVSITTNNPESISINLLSSFYVQRLGVPFPGFIEALILIICFEILRESDTRIPTKMGASVSILGGLVLGEAAVSAGIVSPIMIIVIAISTISGILFTSNNLMYATRYYRILLLLLSAFFGLYGVFIGILIIIIKISSINTFNYPYTAPISPIIKEELYDSIIRNKKIGKNLRNPILVNKNLIRGARNEKN